MANVNGGHPKPKPGKPSKPGPTPKPSGQK